MKKYNLAIVDDHKLFRKGLRFLLDDIPEINVFAEASTGEEFIELLKTCPIDIALMDINMPKMDGISATEIATKKYNDIKIIALSMYSNEEYYDKMIDAGVKGFLLKNSDVDTLSKALKTVINGGTYFSQELLLEILNNKKQEKNKFDANLLTSRETEILKLICKGYSNNDIADELFISSRTVDKHKGNILSKTNCKNSTSLVMYSIKNKLIEI